MARINIDDELHAKKAFKRLVRAIGDEDKAVGLYYRFSRQAQDYWGNEKALMPLEEFEAEGFGPLLEAGLAVRQDGGLYADDAEERFAWYLQRCRANRAKLAASDEKAKSELEKLRAEMEQLRKELSVARSAAPGGPSGLGPNVRTDSSGVPEEPSRTSGAADPNLPTAPVPAPAPVSATATATVAVPAPVPDSASRVDNSRSGVDISADAGENGKAGHPGGNKARASPGLDHVSAEILDANERLLAKRRQLGLSS